MVNSTSITYRLKRKILTFTNKISRKLSKPDRRFTADMVYGILASRSCLLTDISDQLHETVHKANTVKRLSNHLAEGTPASAAASYLHTVKRLLPSEPVVLIDESDIVKPDGKQFEALGIVRDGSESTQTKSVYKKGYHVTEACALTASKHPVSVFSRIHSSAEMEAAAETIVIADSSKLGVNSLVRMCGVEEISRLITDSGITKRQADDFKAAGVPVTVAEERKEEES